MAKEKSKLVTMIVGSKAYGCTRKMAMATIELAKNKYSNENLAAIVAVEKRDMITLMKEVFSSNDELDKGVGSWEHAGFKCYYVESKKEKKNGKENGLH